MTNQQTLITIDNVTVVAGSNKLIGAVSFSIQAGDVITLLGQNGCGKTSLLRQICGFKKTMTGKILIDETPISSLSDTDRVQKICYVPQRLESIPNVNVQEFLQACAHRFQHARIERINTALTRCGLADLSTRSLQVLSGGELRRVLIATAFLNDAPIVLLDEPTSNLDPTNHAAIVALISELAKAGRAVLFATHDLILDLHAANRVLAITNATLSEIDFTKGTLSARDLEQVYGIPFKPATECMIPEYPRSQDEP